MPLKGKQPTNNLRGSQLHGGQIPDGWTEAQANVARQVMVEFMAQGATAAGAAGVVGNWYQESSLNPSESGGLLAQWIGSRYANLRSYAAQIGAPVTSVEAQARFAITEMRQGYSQLWHFLTTTKDPQAAALAVSQQYERPAAWAANNSNRQAQALAAFQAFSGQINANIVSQINAPDASGKSGSGGPSSVLDLLTSPVDALGGWLASVTFNLVKDVAIAIGDDLIIPFWHWNQRAIDNYMTNLKNEELLWTAVFWGFGYALLFTDPDQGNLRPAPVRRSRLARHVRTAQSLPARFSLVKPRDVERKTPKKPKPVTSRATVTQTGTMQAVRNAPVRITGTHGRGTDRSEIPIGRTGTRTGEAPHGEHAARGESDAEPGTGHDSLPDSSGITRGSPKPRVRPRGRP